MNRSLKVGLIAGAVAAVSFVVVFPGFGGEEGRIYDRLDDVVEVIEKSGSEGRLTGLTRARKASLYFTENCQVRHPYGKSTLNGQDAVAGTVASLRNFANSISISIWQRTLDISSGEDSASLSIRAKAKVSFSDGDETAEQNFLIEWVKLGGEWYIQSVSVPVRTDFI